MDEEQRALTIFRELDSIQSEVNIMAGITVVPDLNDILHMTAYFQGPDRSPYEGGTFKLDIQLPEEYPFAVPRMRFITKIWHPNICHSTGLIRMDKLTDDGRSSALGFKGALLELRLLLADPDISNTLRGNIMSHYRTSRASFFTKAQQYTQEYAMQRDPPPHLSTTASRPRMTRPPRSFDDFLL